MGTIIKIKERKTLFEAIFQNDLALVKELLNNKDDPDIRLYHHTAIMFAVYWGFEEIVKELLKYPDFEVNSQDGLGRTPLFMAVLSEYYGIVEILIDDPRVDIDIKDKYGQTALMWAAKDNSLQTVSLLLKSDKIDIDARDPFGNNALMLAVKEENASIVEELLMAGADVESMNNKNQTALDLTHNDSIEELLIEYEDKY